MLLQLSAAGYGEWSDLVFCHEKEDGDGWTSKSDVSEWTCEQAKPLPGAGHLRGRFLAPKVVGKEAGDDALPAELARELGWR